MDAETFEKLSPECQEVVAENFKDNGIVANTYGAENATEDYRRDDNDLEDMEDPSLTGGYRLNSEDRRR